MYATRLSALFLLATVVQAGGQTTTTCPFSRPPDPPLASHPIGLNLQDVSRQNLDISLWQNELLVSTARGVYRSTDAGKTFRTLHTGQSDYYGAMKTTTGVYLASTPSGLLRSTDAGRTFRNMNFLAPGSYPLSSTASGMFAQAGSQIIWGTQNGFYVSDDQGATFTALPCASLIRLANTPSDTIQGCEYLFVRSMTITPDRTKVVAVFGARGLTGVYSLRVPVPKGADGRYQPVYETVYSPAICLDVQNGAPTCPSSGPIAVFNGKVYVGSGGRLLAINSVTQADVVLTSPSNDLDMTGLAASPDSKVIVASWPNSIFASTSGRAGTWTAPNRSRCSNPSLVNWYPTNPTYFKRSIAPVSSAGVTAGRITFAVGTFRGPFLWTITA
ncbi:hypothetical protein HDU96_000435 [Phlyctochytrium bullatum]|nr:hypothetical protein HDU96_000435 [Phlyctochytrium bullatum]